MAHSPGPPAERAANGCRFALYIPKGKSGTTQRRRMGPTVGTITPNDRAAAPAGGAGLLGLLGRQGSGGFLPLWGGPPARFGDFPAVESHARVWGRSAPKRSTGTLRCKPLPGGALHVFGFHLRKERSPMQRIIRLPSSFTVIRETLPAPPHSSQVFRLSTGKH